ncbi:MAG: hypothetical protein EAX91_11130 [Candidatus Lokiarchaeota archaeon]|nr:hypothetical protein [Candidatus Lokiarchaeota archaeon]
MEQVLLKKVEPELRFEVVVLEEFPLKKDQAELAKPQEEQKPVKKALLKLLKKGKYNAKYLEELVSPDVAKRNVYYGNYGYF